MMPVAEYRKKSLSASKSPPHPRLKKRRAAIACCYCRVRKIRCNVIEKGPPCVNCHMDGIECDLRAPRPFPVYTKSRQVSKRSKGSISKSDTDLDQSSLCEGTSTDSDQHDNQCETVGLPNYLEGLPGSLCQEDIEYLKTKGALEIPSLPLRNCLLRSYAEHVHTHMPFLDLRDFLDIISKNNGIRRVSLLFFQAVMFAGAVFIDSKFLEAAGYSSRQQATQSFYERARLLYDFDCEHERIHVIQSLLLMTHWDDPLNDGKDSWYWLGISLSQAYVVGLNRDDRNWQLNEHVRQMCKRLWWCIYSRDRSIALSTGKPMRIDRGSFDIPVLSLEDFESASVKMEASYSVRGMESLHSAPHQRDLAVRFIENVGLYLRVGDLI